MWTGSYTGINLVDEEKAAEGENIDKAVFAVIRKVTDNIEKNGTPVTSS